MQHVLPVAVYRESVPASDRYTEGCEVLRPEDHGRFYVLRRSEHIAGSVAIDHKGVCKSLRGALVGIPLFDEIVLTWLLCFAAQTAESLKIKGLAEMHTASLTKWPSGSSEPGGGDRGDSCSPSPSPLSPTIRGKRLRKSSTGSTSGSGDKPEEINEITLVATNIVKPEPLIVSQEGVENLRRPVNTSTESQGSIDEEQISIVNITPATYKRRS